MRNYSSSHGNTKKDQTHHHYCHHKQNKLHVHVSSDKYTSSHWITLHKYPPSLDETLSFKLNFKTLQSTNIVHVLYECTLYMYIAMLHLVLPCLTDHTYLASHVQVHFLGKSPETPISSRIPSYNYSVSFASPAKKLATDRQETLNNLPR